MSGQKVKCEVITAFIHSFLFINSIKGLTLANADIFLLPFLYQSDMGPLNFKFTFIFTPNSFSHSLL